MGHRPEPRSAVAPRAASLIVLREFMSFLPGFMDEFVSGRWAGVATLEDWRGGPGPAADGLPKLVGRSESVDQAVLHVLHMPRQPVRRLPVDPDHEAAQAMGKGRLSHATQGVGWVPTFYLLIS